MALIIFKVCSMHVKSCNMIRFWLLMQFANKNVWFSLFGQFCDPISGLVRACNVNQWMFGDTTPAENYLDSYQAITNKLKKKYGLHSRNSTHSIRRFLRQPNYAEAITEYSALISELKRAGAHQFAAFCCLAVARYVLRTTLLGSVSFSAATRLRSTSRSRRRSCISPAASSGNTPWTSRSSVWLTSRRTLSRPYTATSWRSMYDCWRLACLRLWFLDLHSYEENLVGFSLMSRNGHLLEGALFD